MDPGPLYGDGARDLQAEFDSTRLADRLQRVTVHERLTDSDRAFIENASFFLLATVDATGWPDVSYKGGDPGFVRIVDDQTLTFPSYDGNGMFRSLGNIRDTPRVGLLFINLERPWRMRIHGEAEVLTGPEAAGGAHAALAVVRVRLRRIFPNCGRYIHNFAAGQISEYVPRPGYEPPEPEWKQGFRDVLPRQG